MIRNFRPAAGFLIDDENENKNDNANKTNTTSSVYRCGSTDILGQQNKYNTDDYGDQIVFHHAGLILDLRSSNERNEEDAQRWMENASTGVSGTAGAATVVPYLALAATIDDSKRSKTTSTPQKPHRRRPRPIHILKVPTTIDSTIEEEWFEMNFTSEDEDDDKNNNNSLPSRYVIQLDILNRFELIQYIQTNWLSKTTVSINDHSDHSIANSRTTELNKRGLAGLNEAILETKTGQTGLCRALQIMTLYREAVIRSTKKRKIIKRNHDSTHQQQLQPDDDDDDDSSDATRNDSSSIVIHCVQGKDRTGMLIMLMQLLIGLSDAEIIDDYYRSNDSLVDYHAGRKKQQLQRQQKQTQQERRQNDVGVVDTTQDEASSAAAAAMIAEATSATTTATTRVAPPRIQMEKHIFGGTNKAAMILTLEGLRHRSSTIATTNDAAADASTTNTTNTSTRSSSSSNRIPIHYFDSIGFNESWRTRFHNVFKIKVNDTARSIVRHRRSRL